MAGLTLADATTMYTLYIEAEKSILKGQSYSIGDRALTRADLKQVAEQREYWKKECDRFSGTGRRASVMSVIPRDG